MTAKMESPASTNSVHLKVSWTIAPAADARSQKKADLDLLIDLIGHTSYGATGNPALQGRAGASKFRELTSAYHGAWVGMAQVRFSKIYRSLRGTRPADRRLGSSESARYRFSLLRIALARRIRRTR